MNDSDVFSFFNSVYNDVLKITFSCLNDNKTMFRINDRDQVEVSEPGSEKWELAIDRVTDDVKFHKMLLKVREDAGDEFNSLDSDSFMRTYLLYRVSTLPPEQRARQCLLVLAIQMHYCKKIHSFNDSVKNHSKFKLGEDIEIEFSTEDNESLEVEKEMMSDLDNQIEIIKKYMSPEELKSNQLSLPYEVKEPQEVS